MNHLPHARPLSRVGGLAAGAVDWECLIYLLIFSNCLYILAPYGRLQVRAKTFDTHLTRRIDPHRPEASGIPNIKISATLDFTISGLRALKYRAWRLNLGSWYSAADLLGSSPCQRKRRKAEHVKPWVSAAPGAKMMAVEQTPSNGKDITQHTKNHMNRIRCSCDI